MIYCFGRRVVSYGLVIVYAIEAILEDECICGECFDMFYCEKEGV